MALICSEPILRRPRDDDRDDSVDDGQHRDAGKASPAGRQLTTAADQRQGEQHRRVSGTVQDRRCDDRARPEPDEGEEGREQDDGADRDDRAEQRMVGIAVAL